MQVMPRHLIPKQRTAHSTPLHLGEAVVAHLMVVAHLVVAVVLLMVVAVDTAALLNINSL
jgi:hypothetical protein